MRLLVLFACLLAVLPAWAIDLREIAADGKVRLSAKAVAARVIVELHNAAESAVTVRVERGTVFDAPGGRLVALRDATLELAPAGSGEMSLPTAVLSARGDVSGEVRSTRARVPELDGLLGYVANHNDVPAVTAQLLVLCVMEDVALPVWKSFLARQRPAVDVANLPTAEDVVAAVDALTVLRQVAPTRTFALAADPELKLRALRQPATRARAMQLYGLALPDAPAPLAPDLGTLLHTKPGDNCPICKQRALLQPREDGL